MIHPGERTHPHVAHCFWEVLRQSWRKTGKSRSGEIYAGQDEERNWEQATWVCEQELSKSSIYWALAAHPEHTIYLTEAAQRLAEHPLSAMGTQRKTPSALLCTSAYFTMNEKSEKDLFLR